MHTPTIITSTAGLKRKSSDDDDDDDDDNKDSSFTQSLYERVKRRRGNPVVYDEGGNGWGSDEATLKKPEEGEYEGGEVFGYFFILYFIL